MEVQGVSCTTCTKKQSMIMAYLYRKNRSPFWYIQYVDSDRKKHDKSRRLCSASDGTVEINRNSYRRFLEPDMHSPSVPS